MKMVPVSDNKTELKWTPVPKPPHYYLVTNRDDNKYISTNKDRLIERLNLTPPSSQSYQGVQIILRQRLNGGDPYIDYIQVQLLHYSYTPITPPRHFKNTTLDSWEEITNIISLPLSRRQLEGVLIQLTSVNSSSVRIDVSRIDIFLYKDFPEGVTREY